jgi:hypothetical protein
MSHLHASPRSSGSSGAKQAKAFESWVREVLIQSFVSPGSRICELFCGKGQDFGKLARARVHEYVGIDTAAPPLEEAEKRWRAKHKPFPATFLNVDPCRGSIQELVGAVQTVLCPGRLQRAFSDRARAARFLSNTAAVLEPGGFLIGHTLDPAVVWGLGQKHLARRDHKDKLVVRTEAYSLDFGRTPGTSRMA